MIAALNVVIAVCCGLIAAAEGFHGHGASAMAYAGFGLGYVGLALLYGGAS